MNCRVEGLGWSVNGNRIIEDVSIYAEEGQIVGIIGPNGSGKSTLLKNIYRVLKPAVGAVYVGEKNIHKLPNRDTARFMSVVSQEETGNFDFSVEEIVLMGRYPYKRAFEADTSADREIIRTALRKTGLRGLEKRRFVTLSGGEKQRVLIARALAQQTSLIILDEPTNHLDIGFKFQVFDIVRETGVSIIAAIHDINLAAIYCDRLFVLRNGRVVADGSPEEVLTQSLILDVFGVHTEVSVNPVTGKLRIYFLGAWTPEEESSGASELA